MQTSSFLRLRFSQLRSVYKRGFTLIELLISAAIITIIAALVLVRFDSFDSTVLLKSFAYEVATSVREAQIYSLSVINTVSGSANFRYPYGLSFTPNASSYTFFRFNNANTSATPRFESGLTTTIRSIGVGGNMEIFDVCMTVNGVDDCTITRLDISFRRPEFSAILYAPSLGSPSGASAGKIYIRSTRNPSNVWIVEVKLLGQIIVYKQ